MQKAEKLEWDSEFFDFPIYRLILKQIVSSKELDEKLSENAFYYIFSDLKLPFLTSKLVDQKVVFSKTVDCHKSIDGINFYSGPLTTDLLSLVFESGIYSRFKKDKRLSSKFEEMYSMWIQKSINGDLADKVFVYKETDKIKGFVTVKKRSDFAEIGLIAVDQSMRGKGIGSKLIASAEHYLTKEGISTIKVPTQLDNKPACDFYTKVGFKKDSLTYIYHIDRYDKNSI
ncbi:MAG: GNAT family N-acetyltransferase [Crocinitomicaceae bacterium]